MALFLESFGLGLPFALGGGLLVFAILTAIAVYAYFAMALMTIGNKLKYENSWLAWIPIANGAMVLSLGGFHWAWIFLILIPLFGWIALGVLSLIAMWRIYEKRNYPGYLALIPLFGWLPLVGWLASLANLVVIGLVAWNDR